MAGESTEPWGTPDLMILLGEVGVWFVQLAVRPRMLAVSQRGLCVVIKKYVSSNQYF